MSKLLQVTSFYFHVTFDTKGFLIEIQYDVKNSVMFSYPWEREDVLVSIHF